MFGMWKETWKLTKRMIREEEGGTVIETAVIVPGIWMIIMGSIFLLFFFFDMGVLRSQTISIARQAATDRRDPEVRSASAYRSLLQERINDRLILARAEDVSVTFAFGRVTAGASIVFRLGERGLTFSDKARAAVDMKEEWVRVLSVKDEPSGE